MSGTGIRDFYNKGVDEIMKLIRVNINKLKEFLKFVEGCEYVLHVLEEEGTFNIYFDIDKYHISTSHGILTISKYVAGCDIGEIRVIKEPEFIQLACNDYDEVILY